MVFVGMNVNFYVVLVIFVLVFYFTLYLVFIHMDELKNYIYFCCLFVIFVFVFYKYCFVISLKHFVKKKKQKLI